MPSLSENRNMSENSTGKRTADKRKFTELMLQRMKVPREGQTVIWDSDTTGLSVLLSAGGTKTFRATYKLHGRYITKKIGRVAEMKLEDARECTRQYRGKANKGTDPHEVPSDIYGEVVDQFIEQYAKHRQRTWDQTEYYLKKVCAEWLDKPITSITKHDANKLLAKLGKRHGRKAALTLAWLKTLWDWAWRRDVVESPIMNAVTFEYEQKTRERVFSDDEIKAIWRAADSMARNSRYQADFVKLLLLLAPRSNELAKMRWSEVREENGILIWITPHERTKSRKRQTNGKKRVYHTPLPPLAERILKELEPEQKSDDDLVFPGRGKGVPICPGSPLTRKIVKHGAPTDFYPHAVRHTIATWLENHGHSEFERGLVLNHSRGGVTAGYSHGYALTLKLDLLKKWADHVERLVQPHPAT
jgi:integrase